METSVLKFFADLGPIGIILFMYAMLAYGAFITVACIVPVKFKAGDWLMVALAPLTVIGLAIYSLSSLKRK